jgi:hypothetical protein
VSAQPPKFPPQLRQAPQKVSAKFPATFPATFPWQNVALKKRASVIFLSAFALVQCAPVLDRVISPVMDNPLFAAQPSAGVAYEFAVDPSGVIRASCAEGNSKIELVPGETVKTSEGVFRQVSLKASLCTDFGYRTRQGSFYVPNELLSADSDVIQGAWDTKTYTGVPSAQNADETVTLQVRKISSNQLEIAPMANGLEQPAFPPVHMTLNAPEDMVVVQNWRSGLLPLKDIRFEYESPFLSKAIILQGKLTKVRPLSKTFSVR